MKIGVKVKMTKRFKDVLIKTGCHRHVLEFGDCVGITDGHYPYPCASTEPGKTDREYDKDHIVVKWLPSNEMYSYGVSDLELVDREKKLKRILNYE